MLLGLFRRWWWRRGHRRFYGSEPDRANPYALNAGTQARFEALVQELSSILKPTPHDTVIDLGGGNGRLAAALFKDCRRGVVLDVCQTGGNGTGQLPSNLTFVLADMNHLPSQLGSFTTLFTYSTFPHLGSERQAKKMLRAWDALLSRPGVLYIGDIPDRRAIPSIALRAFGRMTTLSGFKYAFAVSMISYYSRRRLMDYLQSLGYEVKVVTQSPERRFARERFDLLAVKTNDSRQGS